MSGGPQGLPATGVVSACAAGTKQAVFSIDPTGFLEKQLFLLYWQVLRKANRFVFCHTAVCLFLEAHRLDDRVSQTRAAPAFPTGRRQI